MRSADEHFHEVVVQGVVKLALEAPLELRVVEVARMKIEVVRVHGDRCVLELDDYFYAFAFGPGGEVQERMLVEAELGADSLEAGGGGFGHRGIVKQVVKQRVRGLGASGGAQRGARAASLTAGYSTQRMNWPG